MPLGPSKKNELNLNSNIYFRKMGVSAAPWGPSLIPQFWLPHNYIVVLLYEFVLAICLRSPRCSLDFL